MKKIFTVVCCCLVLCNLSYSQIDERLSPKSATLPSYLFGPIVEKQIEPLNAEEISRLDYNDSKHGHVPHFERHIKADITLNNSGGWTNLPGGDRVWRLQINCSGAPGLLVLFDNLYLPPGATLHTYAPGKGAERGAFTHSNTPQPRAFSCPIEVGESLVIEYYEPKTQIGKGILSIDKVGYVYRWLPEQPGNLKSNNFLSCEVNVACSEGNAWRNQIRSVVKVILFDQDGGGFCSGALVNNTRRDCTPYILSAQHCTEGGVTDALFNQWQFVFLFQASTCNGTNATANKVVIGCKKVADSQDAGGDTGSDFLLLQLNEIPGPTFTPFYSGWDNSGGAPDSGVCIHHPDGDRKAISTYLTTPASASWSGNVQDTHWDVLWAATINGNGVTEPGSSGSPLYNQNGLIIGHLTGGGSCCVVNGCGQQTGPTVTDQYGKVSYDWVSDGPTTNRQLKPWLDPINSGDSTLAGMNPPCGDNIQNDAGIAAINEPTASTCSLNFNPSVLLRNFGNDTLISVTIEYTIDGGPAVTYLWAGILLPGMVTNISLASVTLTAGDHTIKVNTTSPNGQSDNNIGNDTLVSNFYASAAAQILLTLTTDDYGNETTWQIIDSTSTVVAHGGPFNQVYTGQTFQIPICLPVGCYTFLINDANGDGMLAGETGNFTLTGDGNTYAQLTSPGFGSQESHSFCIAATTGLVQLNDIYVAVTPNPSSGLFRVTTDNFDSKSVQIFNALGQPVYAYNTDEATFDINLSHLSSGVYILIIATPKGNATQKLVIR